MDSLDCQKDEQVGSRANYVGNIAGSNNTKLKLSYLRYIMRRQGSLEKTTILGKMEGSRKRGRPNMRWTDSIQAAIGIVVQEQSGVDEDRTLWISLIHKFSGIWSQLNGT